MKTSDYPYFQCSFSEFNEAQKKVVPFFDQDVNLIVSLQTSSGKCLYANTRVLMSDGSYKTLLELYEEQRGFYRVLSLNQNTLKIESAKASVCRLEHGKELVGISTKKGNSLKVTPEHPFLVKRQERLEWVKAEEIKKGDFLAVPYKFETDKRDVNFLDCLKNVKSGYVYCPDFVSQLVLKINNGKKYGMNKNCEILNGYKHRSVERWSSMGPIPVSVLLRLINQAGVDNDAISNYNIRSSNTKKEFKIPKTMTRGLARMLGCIIADGHVSKTDVRLFNYDFEVLRDFKNVCACVFGLECVDIIDKRVKRKVGARVFFSAFSEFMEALQIPMGKKSEKVIVPSYIFSQPDDIVGGFLSGLFDCDGSISGGIEYSSDSEELIFGIQSLLIRFGIRSTILKRIFKGKERYRLLISSHNMSSFMNKIGFGVGHKQKRLIKECKKKFRSNCDIIPFGRENIKKIVAEHGLKCKGFSRSIESVIDYDRGLTYSKARDFLKSLPHKQMIATELLRKIVDSDIRFEEVISVSIEAVEEYVYDLTVPVNHNFIAENTVVHNTAIAECVFGYHLSFKGSSKVVYVSPFKGITSERQKEWLKNEQFSSHGIVVCTGDYHPTDEEFNSARIILMTNESFDNKTRVAGRNSWIRKVSCVVFDEAHLLGKERRGASIEASIMRISRLSTQARLILLSATMSNSIEIAKWVKTLNNKPTKNIKSKWRPVTLEFRLNSYEVPNSWKEKEKSKFEGVFEVVKNTFIGQKTLVFVHSKRFGKTLLEYLRKKGVRCGFHNASLTLENRNALEEIFDNPYSGVDVLISTSTLSAGVNLGG